MRRILAFIFSALLFCGCAEETVIDTAPLDSATEAVNSQTRLCADYVLEITFGDGNVLYYSAGDARWDRELKKGSMAFTQNYVGQATEVKSYFQGKSMINVSGNSVVEYIRDTDILLANFPCFTLPKADKDGGVSVASNSLGQAYKFSLSDTKSLLKQLIGGDIYVLANVISLPQKDKTEYGVAECTYTVTDGSIASARYEFDVKLYDTPVVSPNGRPEEGKYTLDVHVSAKISCKGFGDKVEIEEYSTPDELK